MAVLKKHFVTQNVREVFAEWVRWFGALVAAVGAIVSASACAEQVDTQVAGIDTQVTDCDKSLQSLIEDAAFGDTVQVPGGCVYREEVTIDKPLTLKAAPGSEIRGSDVWTGWTESRNHWVSQDNVPSFSAHGECKPDTGGRCLWPEQVFYDGEPLVQVASDPTSGQFSVDPSRKVVLTDNPEGHTVEVTTRREWITVRSNDVTIQGFKMKHAANDASSGAINSNGYSRLTIEDNVLSYAHGAVVGLTEGSADLILASNDISNGGQLGVTGTAADALVHNNKIHHNNTEDFDGGWEAGGMKTVLMTSLTADENEVYDNDGPGLWCDIDCTNVVYSNNRVHHNERQGIFFEISSGAKIFGNVAWENGWGFPDWGWGAGILSASSQNVEIYDNVVAWNADGISVVSQKRSETWSDPTHWNTVKDVHVHDNTILAQDYPMDNWNVSLAWLQDWEGVMFDPSSNNRGTNNRYWYPSPEGSDDRFQWDTGKNRLAEFNSTPGEERGRYLSEEEKNLVVSNTGIPAFLESP